MPEIKDYSSPVDGLAPQERGSEALAQEGRRVGAFYHQMGADAANLVDTYEQHQQDEEKLNLLHSSTELENNAMTAWQQYANDPANKGRNDLAASFMQEHMQPLLTEWGGHAQTRQGKLLAGELQDRMEQHLFERTSADQSTLTGTWAAQKADEIGNGIVSRVAADPSSADLSIQTIKDTAEALFPTTGIDPATRARAVAEFTDTHVKAAAAAYYQGALNTITEDYAKGSTSSAAEDKVLKDATTGRFGEYVGAELDKIPAMVDAARTRGQERFRVGEAAADKQLEIQAKGVATQLQTQISDAIAAGQPITADMLTARDKLLADPRVAALAGPQIEGINSMIRDGVKAQADHTFVVTNPHVSADLLGRLTAPEGDPRAITEAELVRDVANGQLSKDDYSMYHQALPKISGDPQAKADMKTMDSWIEGYKAQITGKGSYIGGATAFAQFKHDAIFQWMQWHSTEGLKAVEIMTNAQNARSFTRMVPEYVAAARTNDPMAALNKIPGYGHLSGVAEGSVISPVLGPTPAPQAAGSAPPSGATLSAQRTQELAKLAGGH